MMKGDKNKEGSALLPTRSQWAVWLGLAACTWAILFALAHYYWTFGGTWLLAEIQIVEASEQFMRNPYVYITSWAILSMLFVCEALFPLALVWPGNWINSYRLQIVSIASGYVGMIALGIFSFVTQDSGMGLACCGVCALGAGVAVVRPPDQSIPRWMVLITTWVLGMGKLLYGGLGIAINLPHTMNIIDSNALITKENTIILLNTFWALWWWLGGVLFMIAAWLASRYQIASPFSHSPMDRAPVA